jgi:hypothetical protein
MNVQELIIKLKERDPQEEIFVTVYNEITESYEYFPTSTLDNVTVPKQYIKKMDAGDFDVLPILVID